MLVQFENNWMRKMPRTDKLDEVCDRVQFGSPRNVFNRIMHVVLLPVNYIASKQMNMANLRSRNMKTNQSNETTLKVISITIMGLTDTKNKTLGRSEKN